MLELALKGRDIPAQGNALGQGSHHRQSPVRARHNPCPKFLCAKAGFTQLRRRRYGAPAARRHEAGFPLPSPKNQKVQKILKNEKQIQGQ